MQAFGSHRVQVMLMTATRMEIPMPATLAITPRNLGSICLPGYCPKCLRYLLELKWHPPYCHFGAAIFGDMQRSQEAILGYYLDKNGSLPKEFTPFCDCSSRADFPKHWSKFKYTHKSGVVLYGAPDEILRRKNGTLCVIDHKTAHNKGDGDKFHGQYRTQVVGYANIAEGLELGKVTRGGLLYWEAQVADVLENPSDYYKGGILAMPFMPSTVEIKIDYSILDPLLKELKDVWNASAFPEGREGCNDCKGRELLDAIEENLRIQDRMALRAYSDAPGKRRTLINQDFNRSSRLSALLTEFSQIGEGIFSHDGVIANWEFVQ